MYQIIWLARGRSAPGNTCKFSHQRESGTKRNNSDTWSWQNVSQCWFVTDLHESRASTTKKAKFTFHIVTRCCLTSISVTNTCWELDSGSAKSQGCKRLRWDCSRTDQILHKQERNTNLKELTYIVTFY